MMRQLVPLVIAAAALPLGAQSPPPRRLPPPQTTAGTAPTSGTPAQPARPPREHPDRIPRDNGNGVYLGTRRDVIAKQNGWYDDHHLRTALYAPTGNSVRFELNRDAYVALFEIQPGRGVRTIYSADASEVRLPAGWHHVPYSRLQDPLSGAGAPPERGPRYLYLVASEYPLGFPPARGTVQALHSLLGAITFRSSHFEVASALRQRVLTLQPIVGSWTDAMMPFGDNGGVAGTPVNAAGTSVACPNGVVYSVPPRTQFTCPR